MTKQRVHELLGPSAPGDQASHRVDVAILTLITLNIVALVLETVPGLEQAFRPQFYAFEVLSVVVFTAEYLLRIWSSTVDPRYRRPVLGRIRFALTPMELVDLLAVLPFWLPFLGVDLRVLRALRLFRVFRVIKLRRYSRAVQTLEHVLVRTREEMAISLSVVAILILLASSLMYFVENAAQPEAFSSIPATMWWAVATLTTVGYGDVYPVTPLGKVLASFTALLGIGMFALPTSILGAAFVDDLRGKASAPAQVTSCPHCGKDISGSIAQ